MRPHIKFGGEEAVEEMVLVFHGGGQSSVEETRLDYFNFVAQASPQDWATPRRLVVCPQAERLRTWHVKYRKSFRDIDAIHELLGFYNPSGRVAAVAFSVAATCLANHWIRHIEFSSVAIISGAVLIEAGRPPRNRTQSYIMFGEDEKRLNERRARRLHETFKQLGPSVLDSYPGREEWIDHYYPADKNRDMMRSFRMD